MIGLAIFAALTGYIVGRVRWPAHRRLLGDNRGVGHLIERTAPRSGVMLELEEHGGIVSIVTRPAPTSLPGPPERVMR